MGEYANSYGGGSIMYSNVEEVECSSSQKDVQGMYLYSNFGTPVYKDKKADDTDADIKEFDIGEHIISVPIEKDNRHTNIQYKYHEGYEVVGIASSARGKYVNHYSGGVLLYKNIIPVKCTRGDNGYTSFGIPYEKDQVKTLK